MGMCTSRTITFSANLSSLAFLLLLVASLKSLSTSTQIVFSISLPLIRWSVSQITSLSPMIRAVYRRRSSAWSTKPRNAEVTPRPGILECSHCHSGILYATETHCCACMMRSRAIRINFYMYLRSTIIIFSLIHFWYKNVPHVSDLLVRASNSASFFGGTEHYKANWVLDIVNTFGYFQDTLSFVRWFKFQIW